MLKTIKEKHTHKLMIVVNIVLICVLMVVAVYAWFASNANNNIKAYDITVETDNNLEVSFDNASWSSGLDLNNYVLDGKNVMENMKFVNVTSDGITSFKVPQLTQYANYADITTSGTLNDATANKDYLSFTVYMRSKDKLDVYFGSGSNATPVADTVTGTACGNKSDYGDFSKDCVVGAARLSAVSETTENFVWIPAPQYYLENNKGLNTYTMHTNATKNAYTTDFGWSDSFTHYYYNGSVQTLDSAKTITTIPDTLNSKPTSTTTKLASLTQNGDYFTGQITFKIWIEGCDTEARRALAGGKFNMNVNLDSFNAE